MKFLFFHICICQLIGLTGAWFTAGAVREWYPHLNKPSFCPPNWLFGPVWTILYVLMGVAGCLICGDGTCYTLWWLQLALNGVWSFLFFGRQRLDLALLDIVMLWISLALCVHQFSLVEPNAAKLFLPYWAWVSFATLLNFEYWRLNPKAV